MRDEWQHQKDNAKRRGIAFLLTFDQWRDWWLETGHYPERGRGKGKYVMARVNDAGPYELGNIKCLRYEVNAAEVNPASVKRSAANKSPAWKAACGQALRRYNQKRLGTHWKLINGKHVYY